MITDTEGLDQGKLLCIQTAPRNQTLHRHAYIFTERTVTLNTHGAVVGAAVDESAPAGIAMPAIEVRIGSYQIARFNLLGIFSYFYKYISVYCTIYITSTKCFCR